MACRWGRKQTLLARPDRSTKSATLSCWCAVNSSAYPRLVALGSGQIQPTDEHAPTTRPADPFQIAELRIEGVMKENGPSHVVYHGL